MIRVSISENVRSFVVKVGEWEVGVVRAHGSTCAEAWVFEEWAQQHTKDAQTASEVRLDPIHGRGREAYYLETENGVRRAAERILRHARFGKPEGRLPVKKVGAAR